MSDTLQGIAAIVVSHRSAETLDACLMALRGSIGVREIRVVDNDSDDGSMEVAQQHAMRDPRVRFIANPDNPGFAVACNQGAEASAAPWLAFVNPDLIVEPDSLSRMQAVSRAHEGALTGCVLLDASGTPDPAARRRHPDFAAMLTERDARVLAIPARDDAVQAVDAISGALMLLPRRTFNALGGFDTAYRLHAEDLDLCRRAQLAGVPVVVANHVRVTHVRGVSSRSRPLFVEWHKHRGLWRYFRKFDAVRHAGSKRCAVWLMIWGRFPFALLRALRHSLAE